MITLGQSEAQVATNLPPTKGRFALWDWQTFYNAVLHVLLNNSSQAAYYRAYMMIDSLPPPMVFTPQVLAATWARFTQLYPGWKNWDYRAAYDLMSTFLAQTGRMVEGDQRQWWTVEREWQEMEAADIAFIARPSFLAGRY